jgi:hypothetical protein
LSAAASAQVLQLAAENYRKQMESYATLFADEGLPLKCAIFFMHIGKLVLLS